MEYTTCCGLDTQRIFYTLGSDLADLSADEYETSPAGGSASVRLESISPISDWSTILKPSFGEDTLVDGAE
ncbi:unnamed protein product [Echinostoma caproni]|uniref:Uncharacterized protein n=1 Tax=Echinostoma caproni TaxID=27848 RepID=A0A183A0W6_9TREM|nr:unnamed protein product [Echinostoma caproni]